MLALARRIRWSICAPHVGQFDVGVTLFLEVPFRQLWCITPLSGKSAPALTGPRQAWGLGAPRPRGSAFGGPPKLVSPNAGCLYPRMKTGESLSDARLMANNFYIAQLWFFGQPMVMAQKSGATICALMGTRPKQNRTRRGTSRGSGSPETVGTLDAALLFSASTGEGTRSGRRSRCRRTSLSKVFLPRPLGYLLAANRRRQATLLQCHRHEPWWACACSSRARSRQPGRVRRKRLRRSTAPQG